MFKRRKLAYLMLLLLCAVAASLGRSYQILQVVSSSMEPTTCTGSFVVVRKLSGGLASTPSRASILAFRRNGEQATVIKRAIGLPGDSLQFFGDSVSVNGMTLNEPYACVRGQQPSNLFGPLHDVQVPPKSVFLMGDNRHDSEDSRAYGSIDFPNFVGLVVGSFTLPLATPCTCAR